MTVSSVVSFGMHKTLSTIQRLNLYESKSVIWLYRCSRSIYFVLFETLCLKVCRIVFLRKRLVTVDCH